MKFKVDENLPSEYVSFLGDAGFEANTVADENLSGADDLVLFERCRVEGRVLMTLDLDFANVQTYPPKSHAGIVVFRPKFQDKPTLIAILQRLKSVPLWVTENNVNADYANPDGTSNCNPTVKFVSDPRGTSPFFAAFRPYVFSQFGKAANQALYHWVYAADTQSGEVDFNTGSTYLSYWVDYWLAQMFPSTPASPGPDLLQLSVAETSSVEILATKNSDGSMVIMIVDHAVHAPSDNNGAGDPRTVIVDVSALGTFSGGTSVTIDKNTIPTNGPSAVSITPAQKISVTLGGYGVILLKLKP